VKDRRWQAVALGVFAAQSAAGFWLASQPAGEPSSPLDGLLAADNWSPDTYPDALAMAAEGCDGSSGCPAPLPLTPLTGVTQIATGAYHVCAATEADELLCWGLNHWGQLGSPSGDMLPIPYSVAGIAGNIEGIAAGAAHSCATVDGELLCWGGNFRGQLGDDTGNSRIDPAPTLELDVPTTAVDAHHHHVCAVSGGHDLACWGENVYGQLGEGTSFLRPAPRRVVGLQGLALEVATGRDHSCALLIDHSVRCWGGNNVSQIGSPSGHRWIPTESVPLAGDAVAVAAGETFSCALLVDGRVQCWGANHQWQLGQATPSTSLDPLTVSLGASAHLIAAGSRHACAVVTGGDVVCWGSNQNGALGAGLESTDPSPPVPVAGLPSAVVALAAGSDFTCALTDVGTLYCWGRNNAGQVGDGTHTVRNSAVQVMRLDVEVFSDSFEAEPDSR
jgi:alpha-tubulin suppressor-like RCC1 family protein